MKKINIKNVTKINAELEVFQKSFKARTVSIFDLKDSIEKTETKLAQLNIAKKYWEGVKIHIIPESVCNSYKYKAEGTFATIERIGSNWFLTNVSRGACRKTSYGEKTHAEIKLSELAKNNIPDFFEV